MGLGKLVVSWMGGNEEVATPSGSCDYCRSCGIGTGRGEVSRHCIMAGGKASWRVFEPHSYDSTWAIMTMVTIAMTTAMMIN